jgi:hypothetical protein
MLDAGYPGTNEYAVYRKAVAKSRRGLVRDLNDEWPKTSSLT